MEAACSREFAGDAASPGCGAGKLGDHCKRAKNYRCLGGTSGGSWFSRTRRGSGWLPLAGGRWT